MTIVAGRDFEAREIGSDARIAIVNEATARKYFKGRDPIGQRFGYDKPDIEIIGVVRDARVNSVREAAVPMAFYPLDSTPSYVGTMHLRTSGDPESTGVALRKALQEVEPRLPVAQVTPLNVLAANTLRQERLIARLTTVLGAAGAGAGVSRPLWIDVVRRQATDGGARHPVRARRAARRGCCGWSFASR